MIPKAADPRPCRTAPGRAGKYKMQCGKRILCRTKRKSGKQGSPTSWRPCCSGAYVGDKFSPLSDTTNLAAGVSNTGLFDHVSAMVSTTGPTFLLALVLYTILGLSFGSANYDPQLASGIQEAMRSAFNISPLLLIPILVVIAACIMKLPGLVGVMLSVFTGVIFAVIFQGGYALSAIFAVLYALALLMEKSVAVTNRGLEIFHDMRLTTNYELWAWADIYSITYEPDPKNSCF